MAAKILMKVYFFKRLPEEIIN
jgi:hypothetical protein